MPKNTRHFYDILSPYYKAIALFDNHYKKKALKHLNPKPDSIFLDIGCASGFSLRYTKKHNPDTTCIGIDISKKMAASAKKNTQCPICISNCLHLPLKKNSTDIQFSSFVLDLFNKKDQKKILHESGRTLKPGGQLIQINNTRGSGLFFCLSGFYILISRIFPTILLNNPIDTESTIKKSKKFKIKKKDTLGFTDIITSNRI